MSRGGDYPDRLHFGLSLTSAASTGLIFSTAPVWGTVIGSSFGQERPTRRSVAVVVLSIVGLGAVFSEGLSGGSGLARRQ